MVVTVAAVHLYLAVVIDEVEIDEVFRIRVKPRRKTAAGLVLRMTYRMLHNLLRDFQFMLLRQK